MSARAALLGVLIVAVTPPAWGDGGTVRFVEPRPGDVVLGAVSVRFEVSEPDPERIDVYADGLLIGAARGPSWRLAWESPGTHELVAAAYRNGRLVGRAHLELASVSLAASLDVIAVQLYPVVRRGRRYVSDLTADDFVVLEAGEPAPIESFERAAVGLAVAIVLDTSASMEARLEPLQQASIRFLRQLDTRDAAGVYAFDHAVERLLPIGGEPAEAMLAVGRMRGGGGTAIWDALALVLDDLGAIPGRKVMVVYSDGRDERSLLSPGDVAAVARRIGAIVYAIAWADDAADAIRADLAKLCEDTGGELHVVGELGEVEPVYARILADVRAQYALSFTPRPGPPGVRTIEVRARPPGLTVRCRTSYEYDAAAP